MDFWAFKDKALKFKNDMVEKWAKKLAESSMVINKIEDLESFIEKSKTKTFVSQETGETKKFIKKVIVIFWEKDSDFFKKALIQLPVLVTKAFSQNIPLKMCNIELKDIKKYWVKSLPSLVVFETEEVINVINSEEGITKIVTWLTINIEEAIKNI